MTTNSRLDRVMKNQKHILTANLLATLTLVGAVVASVASFV